MAEIADIERVIEDVFKSVRKGKLYRRVRIFTEWPRIVGETNARMTRPVGLQGRTLIVKSDDAAWVDKLKYMEEDLLKRIAEQVGEGFVARIRFVVGEMAGSRVAEKPETHLSPVQRKKVARLLDVPELEGKDALREELQVLFSGLIAHGRERDGSRRNRRSR